MRVAINGTTGLLGRNYLFELIKQYIDNLDDIEIIIFGKGADGKSLPERMRDVIFYDGLDYLNLEKEEKNPKLYDIMHRLTFIDFDLTLPNLGISSQDLEYLKKSKIDYFYHIAALTNFFDTPDIVKELNMINLEGTKNILNLISQLNIKSIIYISSVYHAGENGSEINPNYFNQSDKFRNPYEKTKFEAEKIFISFAKEKNINYKVCRTSTISGRLIENEIGSVSKYDVFYGWAKYLLRYKIKNQKGTKDYYSEPFNIELRIQKHPKSSMNIIPADYAAKLLFHISMDHTKDNSFHLVNEQDIKTEHLIRIMLDKLNICGFTLVNKEPIDKCGFEQMYYRTVGKIFTPYMIDPPIHYNSDNVQDIIKKNNLECPLMTERNFEKLIDYAVKYNFGMK